MYKQFYKLILYTNCAERTSLFDLFHVHFVRGSCFCPVVDSVPVTDVICQVSQVGQVAQVGLVHLGGQCALHDLWIVFVPDVHVLESFHDGVVRVIDPLFVVYLQFDTLFNPKINLIKSFASSSFIISFFFQFNAKKRNLAAKKLNVNDKNETVERRKKPIQIIRNEKKTKF